MIENKKTGTFETYRKKMTNISKFRFGTFKSSQYSRMAERLYEKYFAPKKK